MAFTYQPAVAEASASWQSNAPETVSDITRVRYHIQDTDATNVRFQDEEIQFVLAENDGDVASAVLSLLNAELAKLATQPDFTADWLKVERRYQIEALKALLARKAGELEPSVVSGIQAEKPARVIFTERG